mgnify:FL=1
MFIINRMSRQRHHRRRKPNASMLRYAYKDLKAPNHARTSSVAVVNGLHKSEYAVHGKDGHKRKLSRIEYFNTKGYAPTNQFNCTHSNVCNCYYVPIKGTYPLAPTATKCVDHFGTPLYRGITQKQYQKRTHTTAPKAPTKPLQAVKVCEHCTNIRLEPRKRLYRIVCDHRPITK